MYTDVSQLPPFLQAMYVVGSGELSGLSGILVLSGKLCWFLGFADCVAQLFVVGNGSTVRCRQGALASFTPSHLRVSVQDLVSR